MESTMSDKQPCYTKAITFSRENYFLTINQVSNNSGIASELEKIDQDSDKKNSPPNCHSKNHTPMNKTFTFE